MDIARNTMSLRAALSVDDPHFSIMGLPRMRFTVRWIMVAVALIAVLLGVLRSGNDAFAGALIVAVSVVGLTCKLSSDTLTRKKVEGWEISRSGRGMVVLDSLGRAAAIITAADFTFLVVYWAYMYGLIIYKSRTHYYPYREPGHIATGTALGIVAAVSVASRMRLILRAQNDLSAKLHPRSREPEASLGQVAGVPSSGGRGYQAGTMTGAPKP